MGLAASQGRLLLLTARKSNLELQAQVISQERALLSMQQETIAYDYSQKTNNQIYMISTTGSERTGEKVPLSVTALRSRYNGTDDSGRPLRTDRFQIVDTRTGKTVDLDKLAKSDGSSTTPDGPLQRNLQMGIYIIKTQDHTSADDGTLTEEYEDTWTTISPAGQSEYNLVYYTDDDAGAKAKYDQALSRVQRLDKQLEIKLNQVETQHKAIETEVESVDKVISNNIEGSFKYFS